MTTINILLDKPIKRGDNEITAVDLRKPDSGELRGISLLDIATMKTDALIKLLPRITNPLLTERDVAGLDPADLMALGAEVAGFLLKKADQPDFPTK
jgi:hypothetical protein